MLSSAVESEAEAARMRLDRNGYAEVLDLMKSMKESKRANESKPCYHVPYSVNPRFWGRQDALKAVRQALDPTEDNERQRSFALWGMGGVGKTQIALQYASDSRQLFDTILWVSSEKAIRISQSFRDIARHTGLVQSDAETEDATASIMKVKDWLLDTRKSSVSVVKNRLSLERPALVAYIRQRGRSAVLEPRMAPQCTWIYTFDLKESECGFQSSRRWLPCATLR